MMTSHVLTCGELVELVTEYLEGALSATQRARFEAHLARCPDCTIYLQQIEQTVYVLGELREDSIAIEAKRELLDVFRNWKRD
jgi:anti-sigma factor RsiW